MLLPPHAGAGGGSSLSGNEQGPIFALVREPGGKTDDPGASRLSWCPPRPVCGVNRAC
jgi:hypothetical protein